MHQCEFLFLHKRKTEFFHFWVQKGRGNKPLEVEFLGGQRTMKSSKISYQFVIGQNPTYIPILSFTHSPTETQGTDFWDKPEKVLLEQGE